MLKKLIIYGAVLAIATIALQLLQYKMVIINHSLELYGAALALIFTIVGIIAGRKLTWPKQIIVEKTVIIPAMEKAEDFILNEPVLKKLNISKREYEILELMSRGYSNQQIADKAYISISTVKTHTSNLFMKLDVSRRTEAVVKARELSLIP
jgi:NarL family two-component system response regulator LiaR